MKKRVFANAGIAVLATLPFALLELWNAPESRNLSRFPFALFAFMWILSFAFIGAGASIIRSLRTGASLTLRIIVFALFVLAWTGLVQDQMPCFLGVPNCD